LEIHTNNIDDDLLVKCLLGEADAQEVAAVAQWRKANPAHEQRYCDFQIIWEQSRAAAARSNVDTEAAWARFQQRVQATAQVLQQPKIIPLSFPMQWVRVAAILIVLLGAGFIFLYLNNRAPEMIVRNSGAAIMIDTLPDGSVVTLNKDATFTYPERFAGGTRQVKLEGEAFFNITPDKTKPFIIEANGAAVRVVGTSFNVKTNAVQTEVVVETGIVEVSKKEHKVKLAPHEKAVVKKEDVVPVKGIATDELHNYYRTKEFVCNNTPLWRLVDVLSEAYNTRIVLADKKLNSLLVNTTFRNDSLENILTVLGETFNLSVQQDGGKYFLKPRN
jgi:ferric-dicitrate binding protein FerR (iron transport regulator)